MAGKLQVLAAILIICGTQHGLLAQETVNASGGDVADNGGSVSFSVGQVFYQISGTDDFTVSPGVLHPFEIYHVGVNEPSLFNLECSVYPNPASDYLILELKQPTLMTLHVELFDIRGRILHTQKVLSPKTLINLQALPQAMYILKVVNSSAVLKTIKIISIH